MSARPAVMDHELRMQDEFRHRQGRNGHPQAIQQEAPRLFRRRAMIEDMREAALRPLPKKLLGDLWYEGEIVICFGGPGEGKTALAVQCGNDVASANSTTGLLLETSEAQRKRPVLYYDFELSDIQHVQRYSIVDRLSEEARFTNIFPFDKNLIRVEMSPLARVFDRVMDYEQFMFREIEREIVDSGAKVVIIDNITALAREQDKVKNALPLMQRLCEMKKDHNLSLMILAHTPKREEARPMSLNDLAGSRILANFVDSIFSLGKSALDSRLRIVKQHKIRSGEMVYGSDHVGVFRFEKTSNHLGYELIGHSAEKKHLQQHTDETKEKLIADVREMDQAGRSQRDIANALQVSLGAVNKYLKRSRISRNGEGRIEIEFLDEERRKQWENRAQSDTN